MSSQQAEIRACVCQALEELVDPTLVAAGFQRNEEAMIYARRIGDAVQTIDVHIDHFPTDRSDAAAAVYPYLTVVIDEINKLVEEMVKGDHTLGTKFDWTLHQPIDGTSDKKGAHARWFIFQPDSVPDVLLKMRKFLVKWTIPFLDKYATIEALGEIPLQDVKFRSDELLSFRGHPVVLRVVAAKVLCGRYEEALTVLERWFGRPGPRKQYHNVFAYVEALQKLR